MIQDRETYSPVGTVRSNESSLPRWIIVIAAVLLGLLVRPKESAARVPCPIQGCGDNVYTSCGVCTTINGSYTVYNPKKT